MSVSQYVSLGLALAVGMLLLSSCSQPEPTIEGLEEEDMENSVLVQSNCVYSWHNHLQIGAANIWRDEYVDEDGETRRGLTAMLALWIFGEDQPSEKTRVHVGQELVFRDYRILVIEIDGGGVRVLITPPDDFEH